MALAVTPENLSPSWKRSLAGRPTRSVYYWLAIILNSSLILNLARTFHILARSQKTDTEFFVLLAFTISFFVLADLSILQVYRKARVEIKTQENSPLLVVSYIAFRLYILILGVGIMLLGVVNRVL